ncbi:hypothetical protein AJ80_04208 [Polytolypa hystricis UAMH7299]|uniref:NACHT domain-containing protein n=1 Tax=Polytolypa hystricis (strain UAMH7299) TaxID=1447883 RepID=A0A2B7YD60_POLH7|nr:hypothetical protein AJ80_04208 [Polytolypa hystricis UAMH7299]
MIMVTSHLSTKIIVVIDGLDECADTPDRRQLLNTLTFQSAPMILDLTSEQSLDHDLGAYIVASVDRLVSRRTGFQDYRETIITKLQSRAEKMYLLIKLLLDLMQDHPASSPAAVEELLSSLPQSLSAIYDRLWPMIPEIDEPRAKMIISWILCAFRPLTIKEFTVGIARYDYDKAMQRRYAEFWWLGRMERLEARSHLENPLEPTNSLEWYTPKDFQRDITRLLGPLIQTSHSVGNASTSPRIMLCHQSVKDYFLTLPGFIDISQVHHQMAVVCARQTDNTVTGDPDVAPSQYQDTATVFGANTSPYTEFWYQHSEAATSANPTIPKIHICQMMRMRYHGGEGFLSSLTASRIYPGLGGRGIRSDQVGVGLGRGYSDRGI